MTADLTKDLYDVIRLVRPLYKTLEAAVARELTETGVSVSQRAVLEQLLDHGDLTVPAIGRNLILPRQFVQKIVNELLDAGSIVKKRNEAHKRSVLLALTPAGRGMINRILEREAEVMVPIAEQLSRDDVAVTKATISAMISAFKASDLQPNAKEGEKGP